MSKKELGILGAMLVDPIAWHYGLRLGATAGITPGTVYPLLAKLERSGWLESRWDHTGAKGEPRRRLYRLTGVGQRCAFTAVAKPQLPARRHRRFGLGLPRSQEALG